MINKQAWPEHRETLYGLHEMKVGEIKTFPVGGAIDAKKIRSSVYKTGARHGKKFRSTRIGKKLYVERLE